MSEATDHGREIARFVATVLDAKPQVERSRWDGGFTSDVLVATDSPQSGVTTLATLNISNTNAVLDGREQDYGVELVTCHYSSIAGCIDAIFDAAYFAMAYKEELYPGAVLPDLIARNDISKTMKHFFLITPFLWDGRLKSIDATDRETRYLLAVPISDAEMALAGTEGSEALGELLDRQRIDMFNWNRASVASL